MLAGCGFAVSVSVEEEACGAGLIVGSGAGDECTEAGRRMNWCTGSGCRTEARPCPPSCSEQTPQLLLAGLGAASRAHSAAREQFQ